MNYTVEIPTGFDLDEFVSRASIQGKTPNELSFKTIPRQEAAQGGVAMSGLLGEVVQVLNANPVFFGLLLSAIVDYLVRISPGRVAIKYTDASGSQKEVVGSADEVKKAIAES